MGLYLLVSVAAFFRDCGFVLLCFGVWRCVVWLGFGFSCLCNAGFCWVVVI